MEDLFAVSVSVTTKLRLRPRTAGQVSRDALIAKGPGDEHADIRREQLAVVNADIISNVAQPGRFAALDRGLTFHIRERAPGGTLRLCVSRVITFAAPRGQYRNSALP